MKKKKNKISFVKYLGIFNLLVSLLVIGLIYFINVLPLEYFSVLAVIVLIYDIFILFLTLTNGKVRHFFGALFSIFGITLMIVGINYELNTIDFLKQLGFKDYKTENYVVCVLDSSKYKVIDDLNNKVIGHLNTNKREGLGKAIDTLNKKIEFKSKVLDDVSELGSSLINNNIDAFLVEASALDILKEDNEELYNKVRVIKKIKIELKTNSIKKNINILNTPFNIYLSGIDTYGSITNVSRSDVNIVVSVNPKTKEILLTNIPRDYYVKLHSFKEYDKLTHAGIYGVDESIFTLKDLLNTDINYYVKVNFSSVEEIVNAIGGIEVVSDYTFTSQDGYKYNKGKNKLNGKEALSFVRERKAFKDGDRQRGKNQEIVLTALINKVLSPSIITNYPKLLKSLDDKFMTNFTDEEISKFIKKQMKNNGSWKIESISLDGYDAYDYTYSYKKNKLYVMKQNVDSVSKAQEKISNVMK